MKISENVPYLMSKEFSRPESRFRSTVFFVSSFNEDFSTIVGNLDSVRKGT